MNVNNVMNAYNMYSLWNYLNPSDSDPMSGIPITNNLDSAIKENYEVKNFYGQTTSSELQDIFQKTEPNYGIPLTYDNSGNIVMPASTALPADGLTPSEQNIVSLIQDSNPSEDSMYKNILPVYSEIESGTYQPYYSNIISQTYASLSNSSNLIGSILDVSA